MMIKLPHWPIHNGSRMHDSPAQMYKILKKLRNPQMQMKNVIHIGGTNGKGSTAAFIASILRHANYSVNVYTSPHIFDYRERFFLNGKMAEVFEVFDALETVRVTCENLNIMPTVLEASTIAAFLMFSTSNADFNIIECCMGGMMDCTNVFDSSLGNINLVCTVITSISKDHTQYLGETIAEIALQKAGIQRKGIISVIAKQKEHDANLLLFNFAKKFEVPVSFFRTEYCIDIVQNINNHMIKKLNEQNINKLENDTLLYYDGNISLFLPYPSLLGAHQIENLATALRVCSLLNIDMQNVRSAVQNTVWNGRLQRVYHNKLPQNCDFWFDGAHNPDGAKVLVQWIMETQDKNVKDFVIIGKSKNSDQQGFISQFKNTNTTLIFVTVKGEVFPEVSSNLFRIAQKLEIQSIDGIFFDIALTKLECDTKRRVIVCGSLYLMNDIYAQRVENVS